LPLSVLVVQRRISPWRARRFLARSTLRRERRTARARPWLHCRLLCSPARSPRNHCSRNPLLGNAVVTHSASRLGDSKMALETTGCPTIGPTKRATTTFRVRSFVHG
jgi:hypothetical protein